VAGATVDARRPATGGELESGVWNFKNRCILKGSYSKCHTHHTTQKYQFTVYICVGLVWRFLLPQKWIFLTQVLQIQKTPKAEDDVGLELCASVVPTTPATSSTHWDIN
jgi:hypothetical protein